MLVAPGKGAIFWDHLSVVLRRAFLSCSSLPERSSRSRVRFAAPNNGAPLTAPGRSELHLLIREKGSFWKAADHPAPKAPKWPLFSLPPTIRVVRSTSHVPYPLVEMDGPVY